MSRSRRKNPFIAHTKADSDKPDKRIYHQRMRRMVRDALKGGEEVMPDEYEAGDPYNWSKDGKFRFDPDEFPEYRRK